MHLTFVPPHYGKQRYMMPVLSMTHKLALKRKSASYDLAERAVRGRMKRDVGRERERGREQEREERDWSLSGWKCQCAPGYAFSTCGSCHLCYFAHFCLMLSRSSPHKNLQSLCLSSSVCLSLSVCGSMFLSLPSSTQFQHLLLSVFCLYHSQM